MSKKNYQELLNTLIQSNQLQIPQILEELQQLDEQIENLRSYRLELARICDYYDYKQKALAEGQEEQQINQSIMQFASEDSYTLQQFAELCSLNRQARDYMFGYPTNSTEDSGMVKYLRESEAQLFLMNNCGDPNTTNNYVMDTKQYERELVKMFAHNLGLEGQSIWGYVTSGGTEGNFWGIREGFCKHPQAVCYFSASAHYSVKKFLSLTLQNGTTKQIFDHQVIDSNFDESIDADKLLHTIRKSGRPAVLLLTFGTTASGGIDDVSYIASTLKSENIPFYLHLDAALYGAIPANQERAPKLNSLAYDFADSISISLHKYSGSAPVKGVLIAKNPTEKNSIEYIGQEDSTVLGSRDFMPSTYQRCKESLQRSMSLSYSQNCDFFVAKMLEAKKDFYRDGIKNNPNGLSNIFVIPQPSIEVCKKYQLALFTATLNNTLTPFAHIIIFPHHSQKIIQSLINSL